LIRNRRATQPPAHFHRNPPGRGKLAVFLRCSLDPYEFRYGRFARALKNRQLAPGESHVFYGTGHWIQKIRDPQISQITQIRRGLFFDYIAISLHGRGTPSCFKTQNLCSPRNLWIFNVWDLKSGFCIGLLVPLFFQAGSDQAGSFACGLGGVEAVPQIGWSFAGVCDRLSNRIAHQRDFFR
jgi:hypothetical protein